MDKQMTISAFSDELAQVRTKKKEFLAQIERIVPWKEWIAMIQPCYYKGARQQALSAGDDGAALSAAKPVRPE